MSVIAIASLAALGVLFYYDVAAEGEPAAQGAVAIMIGAISLLLFAVVLFPLIGRIAEKSFTKTTVLALVVIFLATLASAESMSIHIEFDYSLSGSTEYRITMEGEHHKALGFMPKFGEFVITEKDYEGNITEKRKVKLGDEKCGTILDYIYTSEIMNLTEGMEFGLQRSSFIVDGWSSSIELSYKDYKKRINRFQAAASIPMEQLSNFIRKFRNEL